MTATAADETATVSIKNGTTDVTNGSNASWAVGENTLTITVTDGVDNPVTKTYTVTVTRGE